MSVLALVLLWGCAAEQTLELPASGRLTDCDAANATAALRAACRMELAVQRFQAREEKGFAEALASLPEPSERDLVRLRLAIDDPNRAAELCRAVETPPADEKCRQVLGRPHLRAPFTGEPPGEGAP